ncbi:hypothetical protein SAMN05216570_1116 [Dyella sp. OK004]|uniref:hypothetical protein n=1 Tax=Dyella sp. OK004 TaxID=1855292 RepID=UPI0008E1CAE9|nr:hypothetical protein [Dyella sp. OK004]SFR95067.1 hypothetical protein SAMN05216570_1116 [Dyella sp. OK004]
MATHVIPRAAESQTGGLNRISLSVTVVLIAWFLLVVSLGSVGAFVGPAGTPPFAIAIGVVAPLAFFFTWLRLSESFRGFVLSLDLRLIAGIQAWRWAGLGFLFLYAYHVLPAMFALPAGLGDMAIGATAPWIIVALARQPAFAASAGFVRWNVLGIIDLVVALSLGTLGATLTTGAPGEISTAPMASLPLLLIPAFLVPMFLMLHAAALMQSRQMARSAGHGAIRD